SMVLDVKPNPVLNVFLGLDRNVGTLVIETGTENARIYLNNRLHRQTTGRDVLRIPVDVGKYSIRVEKDGYKPPPPQTVEVAKGEEKRVAFPMTPTPASLEIVGALPEAQVTIDGRVEGRTDGRGAFRSRALAPAKHVVELSKDGYVAARIDAQLRNG